MIDTGIAIDAIGILSKRLIDMYRLVDCIEFGMSEDDAVAYYNNGLDITYRIG